MHQSCVFGHLPSGQAITCHTLSAGEASLEVLDLGGIVRALNVPDCSGRMTDVVLGFDRLEDYLGAGAYFGAMVGRIAGRLTGGKLLVESHEYTLACNDGPNHLHGGAQGLHRRIWTTTPLAHLDGSALRLSYHSPAGEEGYPGAIDIAVTYTLTRDHRFIVESQATSDRPTPLCLAHHSYFNLAGESIADISGHNVQIHAEQYDPPAGADMTHSGRREPVVGTAADFRVPRRLDEALPRLFRRHGDFYWLRRLGSVPPAAPMLAARIVEPRSGRVMEVSTNEPCLQFYTAMHFDGSLIGKSGRAYGPHAGFCLECQGHPDASSRPEWGDILVRPGAPQRRTTVYRFSTS